MSSELGIRREHVGSICKLSKYEWAVVDLDKYHSRYAKCIKKFKAYLSPAGQSV
jgi:hypothetical protein